MTISTLLPWFHDQFSRGSLEPVWMSSLLSILLGSEFFMNTPEILLIFTIKEQPTDLILHSKSLVFLSVLSNKCMALYMLGELFVTELHLYTLNRICLHVSENTFIFHIDKICFTSTQDWAFKTGKSFWNNSIASILRKTVRLMQKAWAWTLYTKINAKKIYRKGIYFNESCNHWVAT